MPNQLNLVVSLSQSTQNWLFWARWLLIFVSTTVGFLYSVDADYWCILVLYSSQFILLRYSGLSVSLRGQLIFGLVCDTLFMTWLLYVIDGVLSGWISILLFPALVGSLSSRRSVSWGITGLAIAGYSTLMYLHLDKMNTSHIHHSMSDMTSHLFGMLTAFCVAVIASTGFISYQANLLRRNQKKLVQLQEQQWRERQIVALATLSANTTHQLATPIASAKLLLEEWLEDTQLNTHASTYVNAAVNAPLTMNELSSEHPHHLLFEAKQQLEKCQAALQAQVLRSRQHNPDHIEKVEFQSWLTQLCKDWWTGHNEVTFNYTINVANKYVNVNQNMTFSLLNLLDNAARACLDEQQPKIRLTAVSTNEQHVMICIEDNGLGFTETINESLGKQFIESENGLGIGIALAAAGIERLGGEVALENTESGSMIRIRLLVAAKP